MTINIIVAIGLVLGDALLLAWVFHEYKKIFKNRFYSKEYLDGRAQWLLSNAFLTLIPAFFLLRESYIASGICLASVIAHLVLFWKREKWIYPRFKFLDKVKVVSVGSIDVSASADNKDDSKEMVSDKTQKE